MSGNLPLIHKRIIAFVSANPRITLPELALSLDIERHKIEGALKERYGYGFRELKNRIRLNYVVDMLTENSQRASIKELAAAVNINPTNLSRFIRAKTGCCPRELRGDKTNNPGNRAIRRSFEALKQDFPKMISNIS
jgi:AraC-like DNA-binding protein